MGTDSERIHWVKEGRLTCGMPGEKGRVPEDWIWVGGKTNIGSGEW